MPDQVSRLVARVPQRYRQMYERALRGELSPRAAVKVKCLECCAWARFDGGEDRIGGCSVTGCPLYAYRPFQNAQETAQAAEGEAWDEEGAAPDRAARGWAAPRGPAGAALPREGWRERPSESRQPGPLP